MEGFRDEVTEEWGDEGMAWWTGGMVERKVSCKIYGGDIYNIIY